MLSRGLTRGQFKRLDHILVASRASAHRLLDDVLAEVGLLRQPYLTLPHFTAAAEIVRRTDLTVTLPRRVAVVQPRARLRGPPAAAGAARADGDGALARASTAIPAAPGCAGWWWKRWRTVSRPIRAVFDRSVQQTLARLAVYPDAARPELSSID